MNGESAKVNYAPEYMGTLDLIWLFVCFRHDVMRRHSMLCLHVLVSSCVVLQLFTSYAVVENASMTAASLSADSHRLPVLAVWPHTIQCMLPTGMTLAVLPRTIMFHCWYESRSGCCTIVCRVNKYLWCL